MKGKICVYTCIAGDYDNLHEIETVENSVDYICFTNNKKITSKTWKIIYVNNDGLDNHYLSRKIKILGHPIISKNYNTSVWMDASVIWQHKITDFVKSYHKDKPFSAIKHSQRNSIHEEAIACLQLHKDTKEKIVNTVKFLDTERFPDNLGLYEMTVFIKNHNDPVVKKAMALWFEMIQKYSRRDQLSFTYASWKVNLQVNPIPVNIWKNNWFTNLKHRAQAQPSSFDIYFGDPSSNFDFNNFYSLPFSKGNQSLVVSQKIPNNCKEIYIYLPCIPGLIYSDTIIKPPIENYELINATPYHAKYIFLSANGITILHGSFEKNRELYFSAKIKPASIEDVIGYTEGLCIVNDNLTKCKKQNEILLTENKKLKNEIKTLKVELDAHSQTLRKIYASKSWRAICKIRRLLPLYR